MDNENILTLRRPQERVLAFILFLFPSLLATFLLFGFIRNLINGDNYTLGNLILNLFFILVCLLLGIYYFAMTFGKRELFEINEVGIKVANGKTFSWDAIIAIELKTFPSSGLEFLYYLIGPKGIYFYQIIIYEDFLLKKKSRIKFSSDINTNWDKISEVISHYTIKNNIQLN